MLKIFENSKSIDIILFQKQNLSTIKKTINSPTHSVEKRVLARKTLITLQQ